MKFLTTRSFLSFLEKNGVMVRVRVPVDPVLEITEIASRVMEREGPALLFENPVGSRFPVAINMFGTRERLRWAIGDREPEGIGEEVLALIRIGAGSDLKKLYRSLNVAKRVLSLKPRLKSAGFRRKIDGLDELPVLKCWPRDGGRFFTLPIVRTEDPETGIGNCGMYRLQVYDSRTTGMHWHPHRGGAAHYAKAEAMGKPLPVAVVLGGPPALTFATIAPLPQDVDEYLLAGWLLGEPLKISRLPNGLTVPSESDIVLWGYVPPGERRTEGPFGDHFGYYSLEREFPVFHIQGIMARPDAVYPATIVGKPPKEDGVIGKAVERMFTPLLRLQVPELVDLNTPLESGFHNLAIASARQSFPRAGIKVALALWGLGAMALTKTLVIVDECVDPHDLGSVWLEVSKNFLPSEDMVIVPEGPADTLDISSPYPDRGSKVCLDSTTKPWRKQLSWRQTELPGITYRWESGVLFISIKKNGPGQAKRLIHRIWAKAKPRLLFVTDSDVNIFSDAELLWGVFSRFDPRRDGVVSADGLCLAIDATTKTPEEGHDRPWPDALEMSPDIREKVDARWLEYGIM
ncbi:MAG: menaquinone biosynthesis decarboxylase [Candidatus Hydrothermia bacterium]